MVDPTLLIVFFIYGLAFFSMGLTLALEINRIPASANGRVLRPLAVFGIIHGSHEWLESYLLQAQAAGTSIPGWLAWVRIVLLISSFLFLMIFGIMSFRQPGFQIRGGMGIILALMGVYALGVLVSAITTYHSVPIPWADFLDGMARYLLAALGAVLAALVFQFEAMQAREAGRIKLAKANSLSMWGFFVYALAQLVTRPLTMFPANILNSEVFRSAFGFPVQIIRALAAIVITLGVLWASQLAETERQAQLNAAQKERLEALERVQDEQSRAEGQRRDLLRHVVQAQEDERARIARELHDETAQTLAAFSLDLATMEKLLPHQPECLKMSERLQLHSRQMSQGLYRLVHDLRPAQLDDLGLVPALHFLADHDYRPVGVDVQIDLAGVERRLDKTVETVLFRIAQEALTNVARHARTGKAEIRLTFADQEVSIMISDGGVGFDARQSFIPPRGWGLVGMRERVEAVGGQLILTSAPGQGTQVTAVISVYDKLP